MKFEQIAKDDLKIGDTVYLKKLIAYGFQTYYRHSAYTETTITKITPKRNKIYTTEGECPKNTMFYKKCQELDNETILARMFIACCNITNRDINNENLAALNDEDLQKVYQHLKHIHEIVQETEK